MRLQQLDPGSVLELWLDPGEPMEQVPNSLTMAGYGIEAIADLGEHFQVLVSCPPESAASPNTSSENASPESASPENSSPQNAS
jgi:hypothetical protein